MSRTNENESTEHLDTTEVPLPSSLSVVSRLSLPATSSAPRLRCAHSRRPPRGAPPLRQQGQQPQRCLEPAAATPALPIAFLRLVAAIDAVASPMPRGPSRAAFTPLRLLARRPRTAPSHLQLLLSRRRLPRRRQRRPSIAASPSSTRGRIRRPRSPSSTSPWPPRPPTPSPPP